MAARKYSATAILAAVLMVGSVAGPQNAVAQSTNVLKVARGAASSDVSVNINRAIVLESAQRFVEVSVANPDIADVAALSDQTIYILGKSPGKTTLTLVGEAGRLITNVDISVTPDLSEFKQRLREVLPNEDIQVRQANGGVILSGVVSGARKIDTAMNLAARYAGDNVSNMMSVGGTQQVMLKIRFAEVQRSASKALGFDLGGTFGNAGDSVVGGANTGAFASGADVGGDALFSGTPGAFGVFGIALSLGDNIIDVVLSALETKGVVRSLAEPNLVALSGDTAEFLAGGEVPIPVSQDSDSGGPGSITVEFKPFGVALSFTPTVVDEDLINLELETAVSSIDSAITVVADGISIPGFSVRRASTTVELRDGQSMAIAGLLQDDFSDAKAQLPFLGDVPILGTLFRSSDFLRNQSELVVIVTPVLVTPVDSDRIVLPTDRMRIPNERELFLFGELEGAPNASEVAAQDLDGSYGYILE